MKKKALIEFLINYLQMGKQWNEKEVIFILISFLALN